MKPRALLLVEDNDDDVFFMQRAVKICGITHTLRVVRDGQAAVDYFNGEGEYADRAAFPLPFLVFLDLKMPQKNGLEVLEWIRSKPSLQQTIVLILTTSREESDVKRAYALGVNSYLVKPPNANQLNELIKLVKSYWLDNPQLALGN